MDMTGTQVLPLPRERVWDALNDPEMLKRCIPGCESVERTDSDAWKMVMVAAVGPVKAKFTGTLTVSDPDPPNSYTLAFEGSGGVAGFGKGHARVQLLPETAADGSVQTRLDYEAHAAVGGKIAQVGARLIDGVAKKLADGFFTRFHAALTEPVPPAA
ncbi:MAG: carbon monoxide dehydrogenase subunit G [Burkholderiales bacterium]|jgi:hypothetical protein|nr:carbon monoxide dehydrogenase subunit G [Burkholderiales bacterium]